MQNAMEQTRYWMWTKRKLSGRPLLDSLIPSVAAGFSPHASWEEQAFAEDSAGHLMGYEWPPRSYSCSFCRREFRSAQALGGHMNVHRRDRARLKEFSSPGSEIHSQEQNHHNLNPCTLTGTQYPPQFNSPVYNTSPNPNIGVAASTLPPRVSVTPCTQESVKENLLVSLFSPSSISQDCLKGSRVLDRPLTVLELKLGGENRRVREVDCRGSRDPSEDDEETTTRKRRRADSVLPLFMKSAAGSDELVRSETALKLKPNSVEELDLELRLGDSPPKVILKINKKLELDLALQ